MLPRLAVLFVSYRREGQAENERPFRKLRMVVERIPADTLIVIIDNMHEESETRWIEGNICIIGGNNSAWEFSGWDAGRKFLDKIQFPYDAVLFANDMFLKQSLFHRHHLNRWAMECCLEYDCAVGKRMEFPLSGEIVGFRAAAYIRTHLFLLPQLLLDELGNLAFFTRRDVEELLVDNPGPKVLFRERCQISDDLKSYIAHFLFNVWHRRTELGSAGNEFVKLKTLSILNCLVLTPRIARLREYPLVDFKQCRIIMRRRLEKHLLSTAWSRSSSLWEVMARGGRQPEHL